MGLGKSRMARGYAARLLKRDQAAVALFAVPLHRLTTEQAANYKKETGDDAAIWRGMKQPDPERDDGKAMCLEPDLSEAAQDAGVNVSSVCKVCPSRNTCGYQRQKQQRARAGYLPHNLLFHPRPKAIPAPSVLLIDEQFHDAGIDRKSTRLNSSHT